MSKNKTKIILLMQLIFTLVGCSRTPTVKANNGPFCVNHGGIVSTSPIRSACIRIAVYCRDGTRIIDNLDDDN